MKKCLFALIVFFVCLWLGACSEQEEGQKITQMEISADEKVFSVADPPNYDKGEYRFSLLPGEYIDEAVVKDESIYFESGNYTNDGIVIKTTISKREKNDTEILYTEEREDGGRIEVNELKLAGDKLFWVYSDFEEMTIKAYDLLKKEIQIIETYPAEKVAVLILESDDRFLTWYAVPQEGKPSLYVFDTEGDEVKCLSNDIGYDNPYTRAYVLEGVTSYIENYDEQRKKITIYDLENDQEMKSYILPEGLEMVAVQANREYVIIRVGYENTGIYILDAKTSELQEIDYSIHAGIRPFSWHLLGNKVFINSQGRGNYNDELVILSLEDSTLSWICLDQSVVGGKVREPNLYSADYSYVGEDNQVTKNIEFFFFDE